MNHVKTALLSGHFPHRVATAATPQQLVATASFHATPPLQRKRKTQWHHRFNYYAKRRRNRDTQRTMIRNISEYAEYLFDTWRVEDEKKDASSGPSWFRGHRWVRDSKPNGFRSHEFYYDNVKSKGGFEFCTSDDDEPESIFRNAFRGNQQTYYWSFESDDFPRRNSRRSHSESSRHWSYETEDEDEISPQTEVSVARQALGLSTSGPLKLEDVKSAYRTCALRWHPDRHHGSSKTTAEEKFKRCSAAYQTLCDSLATA